MCVHDSLLNAAFARLAQAEGERESAGTPEQFAAADIKVVAAEAECDRIIGRLHFGVGRPAAPAQ